MAYVAAATGGGGAEAGIGVERGASAGADEEHLVERVLAGDEAAFDRLYERYLPRVMGFVRKRLSNRADTEETVQEVFIAVFSSLGSFRGDAPFAAWVLGIARRVVANRFKKKQHPTVPLEAEHDDLDASDGLAPMVQRTPTPHEHYEVRECIARLEDSAVRHLTREQRTLFELHHLRHQSIHDIATAMHKSEDAVKSNLYRARKVLMAR